MQVDFIVTEYHRWELLAQTLDSLFQYWKEDLIRVIIHRDAHDEPTLNIPPGLWISSKEGVGQVVAIDKLMREVTTEYYLHSEEDFLCVGDLREGIDEAVQILKDNPDCASVSLRGPSLQAHNGHPHEEVDGILRMKKGWNGWSGFSFAPSVRRLSDYKTKAGTYRSITEWSRKTPWLAEKKIGDRMTGSGWCATTKKQYFVHIGGGELSTVGK